MTSVAIYSHNMAGGGAERVHIAVMHAFMERGMLVTLLLHQKDGVLLPMVPPGVRVIEFAMRTTALDIFPLAQFLRQEKPDFLLASLPHNNVVALLAKAYAGSKTRVTIIQHRVLSVECGRSAPPQYRLMPLVYRCLLPLCAGIIAVSNGVADDLATKCRIRRDRITTIYNPVVGPDFATKLNERVALPWRDGTPFFVAAGRLALEKDHATLLRALAIVPDARLLILGTGPEYTRLQALANSLRIEDRVHFAGFVNNPLPYMRAATAFVSSSTVEGFGNAIVEALGCGTPVISTDCPSGPAEILENGRYGRLVPVGDANALAAAMLASNIGHSWTKEELQARAALFSVAKATEKYFQVLTQM